MSKDDQQHATTQPGELLTIAEVARILRVDGSTVRRWIAQETLEAMLLPHTGTRLSYRIKRSTLNVLLQQQ